MLVNKKRSEFYPQLKSKDRYFCLEIWKKDEKFGKLLFTLNKYRILKEDFFLLSNYSFYEFDNVIVYLKIYRDILLLERHFDIYLEPEILF
jgi:hypothetical protein